MRLLLVVKVALAAEVVCDKVMLLPLCQLVVQDGRIPEVISRNDDLGKGLQFFIIWRAHVNVPQSISNLEGYHVPVGSYDALTAADGSRAVFNLNTKILPLTAGMDGFSFPVYGVLVHNDAHHASLHLHDRSGGPNAEVGYRVIGKSRDVCRAIGIQISNHACVRPE